MSNKRTKAAQPSKAAMPQQPATSPAAPTAVEAPAPPEMKPTPITLPEHKPAVTMPEHRPQRPELPAICCGTCNYFVMTDAQHGNGTCRRRAPSPILVGITPHPIDGSPRPQVNGFFPPTNRDIFCGEHEYRPQVALEYNQQMRAYEQATAAAGVVALIDAREVPPKPRGPYKKREISK